MKSISLLYSLLVVQMLYFPAWALAAVVPVTLGNPLAFSTVEELLLALLRVAIIIATPIVILFIVYAGFMYVTAQGNAQKVQEATRALTYAIIGGVLIIGAVAIGQIIQNLVTAFSAP